MSALQEQRHSPQSRRRARLTAVPSAPAQHWTAPAPLRQLPFMLVLLAVLGIGMVGLLLLNTTVQGQSFQLEDRRQQSARLGYTEAELQHQLDQTSSPQSLAAKARELGMRPNPAPEFLEVPTGRVLGGPNDGYEQEG